MKKKSTPKKKVVKAWASRFNVKVKYPIDDTDCHIWVGGKESRGYGQFYLGGKSIGAHVAAYMLHIGEIAKGLTIDHLCKNKSCVNPRHLEAVSMRENVLRSNNTAAINARKTHCKNGHEFSLENTYRFKNTHNGGSYRTCKTCWKSRERKLTYTLP